MKIKQILEGRAEDIDKQIAMLQAEKAMLGGAKLIKGGDAEGGTIGGGNMGAAGIMTPTRVPAAGTGASGPPGRNYAPRQVAAGTGASGPPGRNYATPRPGTPRPGTGEHGPAGRYAPRQVAAGTGQHGPANRYAPKPNYATGGDPLLQSGGEFDSKQDGDPYLQNLIRNAGVKPRNSMAPTPRKNPFRGTPKRGDDSPEWYNKGNTKTAKPNLLKWMKKNATQPKAFDQDNVNK